MAKPLVFQFGETDLPMALSKVDRSKLYGWKIVEAIDARGGACELGTLTEDGSTVVLSGGTSFGYLSSDGKWLDKDSLTPVDALNQPIQSVPSSFTAPIKLFDTATVDEYFQHNIKSIYQLTCETETESETMQELMSELNRGTIFRFPYSYRGGLEADSGFMLTNESGHLFLAIGEPTQLRFFSLQQAVVEDDQDEADDDIDLMDFDMI